MLVQFKRTFYWWETQKTHKCGDIIEIDKDQYRELSLKGVIEDYKKPSIKKMEVLEGNTTIKFIKSTEAHKCGDIDTLEANAADFLIRKGIAIKATEEKEENKLVKLLSKMNKEELLDFAKEKNITILYKNEDLIRQSIKIALLYRGENND